MGWGGEGAQPPLAPTLGSTGLAGLPGPVHVVVLPLDTDPHGLIHPLLLRGEGVDLVGLAVVGTPGGGHVGLGEMGRRSVGGVEEGLVVAHHRQSLLEGREETEARRHSSASTTPHLPSLGTGGLAHGCPVAQA